eukprot:EG_transcript_3075
MSASTRLVGHVAVVEFQNGSAKTLAWPLRRALVTALQAAVANSEVDAIVLIGANRNFSAGADPMEYGPQEAWMKHPQLSELCELLETVPKPIVAAIQGTCIGSGLEVAMCCDYRVAARDGWLGLPDVRIGLVSKCGGTQRLPRLVGLPDALDMILTGKVINPDRALRLQLVDAVAAGDLAPAAVRFAEGLRPRGAGKRRCSDMPCPGGSVDFAAARKRVLQSAKGLRAPLRCLEAVEWTTKAKTFQEGLAKEHALFLEALRSAEAKALQHVFFAERQALKVPGVTAKPIRVRSAAVIGAGTMGGGIAMCFATAGIPVYVVEANQQFLDAGVQRMTALWQASHKKGRLSAAELARRTALVRPTLDYAQLANVDVVVEAVVENMQLKKDIFQRLDAVCKPSTILATNTSTLNINEIAAATKRPGRVCGMHFFSPANVMRLLENVRGDATDAETLVTIMDLGRRLNKVCIMVGVCHGFVSNRMSLRYNQQTELLLEEGALPEVIDKAMRDFGFAVGPCQMGDIAGIDVAHNIRAEQLKMGMIQEGKRGTGLLGEALYAAGRLGQKNGKGYYRYEGTSRQPVPDPAVADLIVAQSRRFGLARRTVTAEEVVLRLMCVLVNEASALLAEGIAARASDVDVCWLYGFGFPPQRGGPLFWADTVGLPTVLQNIQKFRAAPGHADFWPPCPLLEELVATGRSFRDVTGQKH